MRRILLSIAIAGCIVAPTVLAQGRSGGAGGPPAGGAASNRPMSGPSMDRAAGMGRSTDMDRGRANSFLEEAAQRRAAAKAAKARAVEAEQAQFGQDTAERAKALKDADLETRQAFGDYQAALARQKSLEADANSANAGNNAFGQDTAARARALKEADLETRKAFGALQAAAAKAKALGSTVEIVTTANASSDNASFGLDTSTRARMQQDATVDTRKTFGENQSTLAKGQERGDPDEDDGDE